MIRIVVLSYDITLSCDFMQGIIFFVLAILRAPRYEHSFMLHMSFNLHGGRPITKTNPLGEILFEWICLERQKVRCRPSWELTYLKTQL